MSHAAVTIELLLTQDEASKLAALLVATAWVDEGEEFGDIYGELIATGVVDDGYVVEVEDSGGCELQGVEIVIRRSEDA